MPVTLRLTRRGTTNRPYYHIVATDSRHPRDGRFLEQVGTYDPLGETKLTVNEDKAKKWLSRGATQSDTVKKLLRRAGVTGSAPVAAK
jgi:small subunit ribosomal protein S16